MPHYMVHAHETACYHIVVEAETEEEAISIVRDHCDVDKPTDWEDFVVESADLITAPPKQASYLKWCEVYGGG